MRNMSAKWPELLDQRTTGPSPAELEFAHVQLRDAFRVALDTSERVLAVIGVQPPCEAALFARMPSPLASASVSSQVCLELLKLMVVLCVTMLKSVTVMLNQL